MPEDPNTPNPEALQSQPKAQDPKDLELKQQVDAEINKQREEGLLNQGELGTWLKSESTDKDIMPLLKVNRRRAQEIEAQVRSGMMSKEVASSVRAMEPTEGLKASIVNRALDHTLKEGLASQEIPAEFAQQLRSNPNPVLAFKELQDYVAKQDAAKAEALLKTLDDLSGQPGLKTDPGESVGPLNPALGLHGEPMRQPDAEPNQSPDDLK